MKGVLPLVIVVFASLFTLCFTIQQPATMLQVSTDDYQNKVETNRALNEKRRFDRKMLTTAYYSFLDSHAPFYMKKTTRGLPGNKRHGFSFRNVPSTPNPTQNKYRPGSGFR
jgi:hypothetical protein